MGTQHPSQSVALLQSSSFSGHIDLYSLTMSLASLQEEKNQYQEQLDIVAGQLKDDPGNAELAALKKSLTAPSSSSTKVLRKSSLSKPRRPRRNSQHHLPRTPQNGRARITPPSKRLKQPKTNPRRPSAIRSTILSWQNGSVATRHSIQQRSRPSPAQRTRLYMSSNSKATTTQKPCAGGISDRCRISARRMVLRHLRRRPHQDLVLFLLLAQLSIQMQRSRSLEMMCPNHQRRKRSRQRRSWRLGRTNGRSSTLSLSLERHTRRTACSGHQMASTRGLASLAQARPCARILPEAVTSTK